MASHEKGKSGPLRVLYFGIYSKGAEYPRNNNLIRGLRANGVQVEENHCNIVESFEKRMSILHNPRAFVLFFLNVLVSYVTLSWKFIRAPQADAVIVGHPGYFHIHLAWVLRLLFRRRTVLVYDVFIPLYEMLIEDRKLMKAGPFARIIHRVEASCLRYADVCLIDTEEHRRYLIGEYGLAPENIVRVFVGATIGHADEPPRRTALPSFNLLFVGTYIPLHGIDVILGAARRLMDEPDIRFSLVGSGQLRESMEELARRWGLSNVAFIDWIPTDRLGTYVRSFDLSLGIFGTTPKAARVIPSKIYDICAVGVPFITADTPAVREAFRHGENAYLVPPGDSKALAHAIRDMKAREGLRKTIAEGTKETGETRFSLKEIGRDLIRAIS